MQFYEQIPQASTSSFAPITKKRPQGPPPDLTERRRLKAQYVELQKRYFAATRMRTNLTLEVEEKSNKVQRLQDEVDLIIDQIYDSDYRHLAPLRDSFFSDDDDQEAEDDLEALETDETRLARQMANGVKADDRNGNEIAREEKRDDGERESGSDEEHDTQGDKGNSREQQQYGQGQSRVRKAASSDYGGSSDAGEHKRARLE